MGENMMRTVYQPEFPKTSEGWRDWWNNFFENVPFKHSGGEICINMFKDPDPDEKAISDMLIKAAQDAAAAHNLKVVIKYEAMGT